MYVYFLYLAKRILQDKLKFRISWHIYNKKTNTMSVEAKIIILDVI